MLDDVKDHYRALWGEPSREAWFRMFGSEVEIYKWDADTNPEEVVRSTLAVAWSHSWVSSLLAAKLRLLTGRLDF